MSLKAFHLVFMTTCILASAAFGTWAINDYRDYGHGQMLFLGIGSFVLGIGFILYTLWFLKKLKNVSYL